MNDIGYGSAEGRKIALARFHDGKAKANWGGRGTSLALAGLIAGSDSVGKVIPLNGEYITGGFGDFLLSDKLKARAGFVGERLTGYRGPMKTRPFPRVEEYAERVLKDKEKSPRAAAMVGTISECDELWMNGEGDLIMGYSGTLWRTLLTMSIAQKLGKPTVLVNSILSAPSSMSAVPEVIEGVGQVLAKCSAVIYRDPTSLDLNNAWFPGVSASWLPDALFAWADFGTHQRSPAYGPDTEGLPLALQSMLRQDANIVSISGSSVMRSLTSDRAQHLSEYIRNLKSHSLEPVLVATSDEDAWLEIVAEDNQIPFVPARLPLRSGMELLAASRVFVSGRYHPSILAACVGTPLVTFGSNSHKTLSLLNVLGVAQPTSFPTFDSLSSVGQITEATLDAADGVERRRAQLREEAVRCAETVQTGLRAALSVSPI